MMMDSPNTPLVGLNAAPAPRRATEPAPADTFIRTEVTPPPIQVMIVDDHILVRDSLKIYLLIFNDIEVVAEANSGEQALSLCAQAKPDVILLDMVMPGMDGPTTTQALREHYPSAQVIVLTSFQEGNLAQQALQAGAISCLYKDAQPEELVAAIRASRDKRAI
jgi:DNA-binding NarL/FixJ family response regulator